MSVWKTPSNSRSSTRWDLRARIPSGLWTLVLWLRRRWTSSKRSWPSSEERPTLTPTSTAMTAWPRHPRSFCRTTTLMIFMKMIWWELWEFSESWKMEKWFNSFSTQCPFLSVCMKPIFLWCFKDALVEANKTRFTTLIVQWNVQFMMKDQLSQQWWRVTQSILSLLASSEIEQLADKHAGFENMDLAILSTGDDVHNSRSHIVALTISDFDFLP